MLLTQSYSRVKPAIVAFCSKYTPDPRQTDQFPHIIGTGFIIDSCGLILTNQHVVDEFANQPCPQANMHPLNRVAAVLFDVRQNEIRYPGLEITGETKIISHIPGDKYFERKPPDIALVGVNVKGLPHCEIDASPTSLKEGLEVATAGFPMGRLLLSDTTDGSVRQLSPVLQRGVISALQPWAVDEPLSFTISVLIQGGASGSPVFSTETGRVLGILSARRIEPVLTGLTDSHGHPVLDKGGNQYRTVVSHPTNFSMVVPAFRIADKIDSIKADMIKTTENKQITLDELYRSRPGIDFVTGREVDQTTL